MYSCNVPVPSEVSRLARGLATELFDATPRDRHTFVLKRFGEGDPQQFARAVRETLAGAPPFPVHVTKVDAFWDPPSGSAPVVYLHVESPPLRRLHHRLCQRFDPIEGLEAAEYDPHITIARGGDAATLVGRSVDIEWTVDSLFVWSAGYGETVERISLPL